MSQGAAADWARFPAHLEKSLRGLSVESQEDLAVGRRWSLQWGEQRLSLDAHVFRRDEAEPLSAARVGGERSKEKLGDLLIEFGFKPDLLWQFKNVTLHLQVLTEESPSPTVRARLLQLAKQVQAFLEASLVRELDAVTPRLELTLPEDRTLLLGTPLRLPYRALNMRPEELHLDLRSDGFKDVAWAGSELIATPERIGSVQLWLSLRNTRTLLRSAFTEFTFQCVRERGHVPSSAQARALRNARIEEGSPPRLRLDSDQRSPRCTEVFIILLDEHRTVALEFGGPRYTSAPAWIAMRLQKALLLEGGRAPVSLAPSELHLDQRHFPKLRGTISLAGQDWEITTGPSSAPADPQWMEELRRRGLQV